jgi:hypothetical protein
MNNDDEVVLKTSKIAMPSGFLMTMVTIALTFWMLQAAGGKVAGATPLGAAPTITAVSPASASNDLSIPILITGANFVATPTVAFLGGSSLVSTAWVSSSQLQATVPAGLSAGVYTLTVTNPDTQIGTLTNAFTVNSAVAWTSGGPYGGEITELTTDPAAPGKLFTLAQNSGLFGSSDGAANWTVTRFDGWPSHFAVDAISPTHMYLGTYTYQGLSRSEDGGASWSGIPLPNFYGNAPVYPVTHPITPGVVYAGISAATNRGVEPGELAGVIRTDDYGATWVSKTVGMTDTQVTSLAFMPGDASKMLAGTRFGNVFASSDGGETWVWAAKPADYIGKVYFNPNAPADVWAVQVGVNIQAKNPNLFRSSWSALGTWNPVDPMPGFDWSWVNSLAFASDGTLWAGLGNMPTGIYTSTDAGANWSPVASAPLEVTSIALDPVNAQVVYAGTRCGLFGEKLGRTMVSCGVYKSVNGGVTWQPASEGLAGLAAEALAAMPSNVDLVYTYNERGLLKSTDGGSTWQQLDIFTHGYPWMGSRLSTAYCATDRVYLGGSSDYLYPGSHSTPTVMTGDFSAGWRTAGLAKPAGLEDWSGDVYAVASQLGYCGHVLAGATFFPPDFGFGPPTRPLGGIYLSSDWGVTWHQANVTQAISGVVQFAFDVWTPMTAYAGTGGPGSAPGTGLLKSIDGGENWWPITSWPAGENCTTVNSIAAHTQRGNTLIVSCTEGAYYSSDAGGSWTKLAKSWPLQLYTPASPPKLYGGSRWGGNGLSISSSDGQDWVQVPGLPANAAVYALAAASNVEQVALYTAISGGMAEAAANAQRGGVSPLLANKLSLTERPLGGGVYRQVSRRVTYFSYLPLVTRPGTGVR